MMSLPGVTSCTDACDSLLPWHNTLVAHMATRLGPNLQPAESDLSKSSALERHHRRGIM